MSLLQHTVSSEFQSSIANQSMLSNLLSNEYAVMHKACILDSGLLGDYVGLHGLI